MRSHAFILALCVCAHYTRAASIALDLDNVNLDEDQSNVVSSDNLRKPGDIPVKVIEEPVLDENSNDYIPPDDTSVNVKRIEVDLTNPGPPQRQEHETQNPENFSDNDKIVVAIKHSIDQAQHVFNDGLKHVSDSFKTFLQADEDLPLIQQNIKNLKETFNGQFEKLNETIRGYLEPQTSPSGEKTVNPKLEIVQAHLQYLNNNFKAGVDTLAEGVDLYSIIKEEDEAEKAIALKADVKAEPEVASSVPADNSSPSKPVENPPAQPAPANPAGPAAGSPLAGLYEYLANMQTMMSNSFSSFTTAMSNTFNNNNANNNANGQNTANGQNNANGQNPAQPQGNPITDFWQNIFQGQNAVNQQPATQDKPNPSNTQADPVPAPTPTPWGPQAIIQTIQSGWNSLINQNQNNQQKPQTSQPATNPFQQVYQNFVSLITPQTPQPAGVQNPATPTEAVAPEKAPERITAEKPVPTVPTQATNVVPAPVNEQPEAQPSQAANPAPAQTNPIQQLVQNNPIIKGIQSAVQRIQGTPNPETPREEIIQDDKKEIVDPKGHHHGGYLSDNNVTSVGDSSDSGRVEEKVKEKEEEKLQDIPTKEKEVLEEPIKAEELKAPLVSDKTE